MNPISQKQASALVKVGNYTYEEIRNWDNGYAGKVLRELLSTARKKRRRKPVYRTYAK